jgi:hypothetical protein
MPAPAPATPHAKWVKTETVLPPGHHQCRAEQENMHAARLAFGAIGSHAYSAIYG